jgi:hypothetical protein
MSAISIIPSHQLAAATLFFYALVAVFFSVRKPPKPVPRPPLTHLDVDIRYCSEEELEFMQGLLIASAPLNEAEISRFWDICSELDSRRWN